jgi:phosphate/sulfate permease
MPVEILLLSLLTLFAGFYLAWNIGANDVANAMGTSVGSGALTLKRAVIVAAILEFSGAFFFGEHVSETVQSGIIKSEIFASNPFLLVYGMLAALLATGAWLQWASYFGWPVSTTHAIVGGVVGFGTVIGGFDAIYWDNVAYIVSSWVLSPVLGGILSFFIFNILRKQILYKASPLAEAKKITPILVFVVFTVLSLMMMLKGLHNLNLEFTIIDHISLSCLIGLIGAGISYLCVQRIEETPIVSEVPVHSGEVLIGLDKAKKHLQNVRLKSSGEVQYQVSLLLEEIDALSSSLYQAEEIRTASSEYTMVEKIFGYLQIMSACLMAFAHGANDVANAIGPLSASIAILTTGVIQPHAEVPAWALALGGIGIVIGLATWGWRVIETIGKKITELTPTRGFAAEFGAAATILIASRLGLPVSTTHTLVGSVIGVGLARGIGALNLAMTRDIVLSWIVTVPVSAIITVIFFLIIRLAFS